MIKVTLADGSVREAEDGSSVLDVAKSISRGLAKEAVAAKDLEKAEALLKEAFKVIDKSYSDGVQPQNTVARQKASLQKLVNTLKA